MADSTRSFVFTKFATSAAILAILIGGSTSQEPMRERVLREAALNAGLQPPETLVPIVTDELAAVGLLLFESQLLSLNGDTSCSSCHLDRFGSADGLRVAVGVGGVGEGEERAASSGLIVPRNTLPLWGRGGLGFNTFFWDGRVSRSTDGLFSQFGDQAPTDDPLVVAAHLPVLQIREMLVDDELVSSRYETETVESGVEITELIAARVREDAEIGPLLAEARGVPVQTISYLDIAEALAGFIRSNFRMRESRFSDFVFNDGDLSEIEFRGGLVFFGKGRCSSCHSGPYLTDFEFYSIPVPQAGFGMNGFGVDYGRYNATLRTEDLYLFRTPPLWQVSETAPYSHSGSVDTLEDMIRYHFDPLFAFEAQRWSSEERVEFSRRLSIWGLQEPQIPALSDEEVEALESFLHTLRFHALPE